MPITPVTVRPTPLTNAYFELFLEGQSVAAVTAIGAIKSSVAANPSKDGTQLYSVYSPGAVTYEACEIKQAQVLDVALLNWFEQVHSPVSAGAISVDGMKKNLMIHVKDSQMRPRIQHELFSCLPTSIAWDALDSNAEANTFLTFSLQYEYSLTKYLEP
ncbi:MULTISPECIES: phage tail protein [Microbulbifer]|uniref:phage tail protein n=1 Tax=Microbulbifer TaxID=48073 RepID=UPI001E527070|nr:MULTISPECIES: phage tail protein [Microbulbifer]UHQ55364.1 phage tail protein [Microbulbifer sp. YPW16]